MKKEYILFIDSGFGGLSTLAETYKIFPDNFIYFADNKNSPYGAHTKEQIYNYLDNIISNITKKFNIKLIVLACNTATTSSAKLLREKYKEIPIIGTEPAIKVAVDMNFKKILSLSTPATKKQASYTLLCKQFENNDIKIKRYSLFDFAKNIDNLILTNSILANFRVLKNLYEIKKVSKNYDCIILGCTHFCLLKNTIQQITNKITLNGNAGVAQHIFLLESKNKKIKNYTNLKSVKFLLSKSSKFTIEKYKKTFKQILANL